MRAIFFSLPISLLIIACNNSGGNGNNTDTTGNGPVEVDIMPQSPPIDSAIQGCYSMINNRDTASLQLIIKDSSINGSLSYSLYQKDHNVGTFQGEIVDGMLLAWYMFKSEGVMSVRQEVFRIGKDELWPAMGEVAVRNDTAYFSKPDQLKFDSTRAFKRVQCAL
ncbi:MAG TPA: hypothetical protein VHM26_04460 [Chitinophagaceae bacterium]|nr:hypothetical protein [Chitinophagaceae bacterium]